jgi:hypothetical protein
MPRQADETIQALGHRPGPGVDLAAVMQKLEEINCLLAAVDVIAKAEYERGFADGRAALAARLTSPPGRS